MIVGLGNQQDGCKKSLRFQPVYNINSQIKSNQISLFLTQLQLQQNELKQNTQNAQSREKKFKVSHQINPVAEAYRATVKGP